MFYLEIQIKCFREINETISEHLHEKLHQSHNSAALQRCDPILTMKEVEDSQIQIQMVQESAVRKCVAQMGI